MGEFVKARWLRLWRWALMKAGDEPSDPEVQEALQS
jgi:hypothetical protein